MVKAGVRLRPQVVQGPKPPRFEREMMVDLYVRQRLPIVQVAARLGLTAGIITQELKKHGIERRPRGSRARKYPDLSQLQIGDSVLVPRPSHKRPYPYFCELSKKAGIRISIRSIGETELELVRVS